MKRARPPLDEETGPSLFLRFGVEDRGFEPLTSCMTCKLPMRKTLVFQVFCDKIPPDRPRFYHKL